MHINQALHTHMYLEASTLLLHVICIHSLTRTHNGNSILPIPSTTSEVIGGIGITGAYVYVDILLIEI